MSPNDIHPIETFCREKTRFSRFFDDDSGHADHSRPPVTVPDTDMPSMFPQCAPTPVADYITKNGNVVGGFPIERVARPIIDLVTNFRDMDGLWRLACGAHWNTKEPPKEVRATLHDARRFFEISGCRRGGATQVGNIGKTVACDGGASEGANRLLATGSGVTRDCRQRIPTLAAFDREVASVGGRKAGSARRCEVANAGGRKLGSPGGRKAVSVEE
ncbi:hypothetical protein DOTSEDRAFT_36538 [Dothistroma septosporum NZE10]|uniref:Uncharacterized protein n=1 Tax=Dothistroma septosporum (strain NZE10 / CBS 128990) TaxID=675120 RepID=N1PJI7_DOTSN|nr:hypothetical protein DOTSEDRAFT_36538 [Dothistroma septosporum NZE10]